MSTAVASKTSGTLAAALPPDRWLLGLAGALVAAGVLAVYSASFAIGLAEFGDGTHFVVRQVVWAIAGLIAMGVCMQIDYRRWRRISPLLLLVSFVMLALVLIPGAGINSYGATRWLQLGPMPALQPSEFAKLACVIYFAAWLGSSPSRSRSLTNGFIPFGIIVSILLGLIMLQPDLGTALIIALTSATMLFLSGADLALFTLGVSGGLAVGALLISSEGYRLSRWHAFVDPWADPTGQGFQIIQLLIALGTGGITGVGFGASRQKFHYVPGAHTDGIIAIIGEELGFIAVTVVIFLFCGLVYRGFRIAYRAPDTFGRLLALGIVCWIGFQALLNIGGITRSVPLAGVPLPLISYGGSSLLAVMAALGILANISTRAQAESVSGPSASFSTGRVRPGGSSFASGDRTGPAGAPSADGSA